MSGADMSVLSSPAIEARNIDGRVGVEIHGELDAMKKAMAAVGGK